MDEARKDETIETQEKRPQRGGEGATTRFGLEETTESEVPATGGPIAEDEEEVRERPS